jgi:hypothetical protein
VAHFRLLSAVAIVSLLACTTACALGPIYARRIEGKVVEKGTGKPVAGAEVFAGYEVNSPYFGVDYTDWRWVTTEEDGSFAIPGHVWVILGPPLGRTEPYPGFQVLHKDYGMSGVSYSGRPASAFPGWRNIVLEIERGPGLQIFEDPNQQLSACPELMSSDDACERMCVIFYGSVEACARHQH